MLTRRQAELLDFLRVSEATLGYCPSYQEMKHALGLKSASGIHRLVTGLDERGFIRRLPGHARAITTQVTPAFGGHCPTCGHQVAAK